MGARPAPLRDDDTFVITLRWPWWLHPLSALLLVPGLTAAISVTIAARTFESSWFVPKFLDSQSTLWIFIGIAATAVGIIAVTGMVAREGARELRFDAAQVRLLERAYRVLLVLTVLGYVLWVLFAVLQGVRLGDLVAVVTREPGAISALKSNSRPVGGLTTLTQFGPVAVAIGTVLRRLGRPRRGDVVIIGLAMVRSLFYAERLATIEVLMPVVVILALTTTASRRAWVQVGPLLAVPGLLLLFAASEYTRSWIYYQRFTDKGFAEWVLLRFMGYYATSYNNSALFAEAHRASGLPPYYSADGVWNAPGASVVLGEAVQPRWWQEVLATNSNPEFNNPGSFLVTWAELGPVFSVVYWLVVGALLGVAFVSLTRGSVVGVVAVSVTFAGIMELPRYIYWTQGRAIPVLLAVLVLARTIGPALRGSAEPPADGGRPAPREAR